MLDDTAGPSIKLVLLADVHYDRFDAGPRRDDASAGHDVLVLRLPEVPLLGQLFSLGRNGKLREQSGNVQIDNYKLHTITRRFQQEENWEKLVICIFDSHMFDLITYAKTKA